MREIETFNQENFMEGFDEAIEPDGCDVLFHTKVFLHH